MRSVFTRFVAFTLAVALLLTAETLAMARGANAAVAEITLCTGHGPTRVFVDAEGTPTAPPTICGDCVIYFASLGLDAAPVTASRVLARIGYDAARKTEQRVCPALPPSARAPPELI